MDHEDLLTILTNLLRDKERKCAALVRHLIRAKSEIVGLRAEVAALRARLEAALSPVAPES